jgi:hypothetical protein
MAVRTANFLSGFLQVVDPKEIFPGKYRYTAKKQYRKSETKIPRKGIAWQPSQFPTW